jgi:hypothetical protein
MLLTQTNTWYSSKCKSGIRSSALRQYAATCAFPFSVPEA